MDNPWHIAVNNKVLAGKAGYSSFLPGLKSIWEAMQNVSWQV